MKRRAALGLIALLLLSKGAAAECRADGVGALPVTMTGHRAIVDAKINGADAPFVIDSGAFFSTISPAAAAEFKLPLTNGPYGLRVVGIGGETDAYVTTVKAFTIAGTTIPKIQFVVSGNSIGGHAVGLLGQNVLRIGDAEYDFADGIVRFWRPRDCGNRILIYWLKPDQRYGTLDVDPTSPATPHTVGFGYVNGVRVRIIFDTGASFSALSLSAARRAGINLHGPGVASGGQTYGLGRKMVDTWIAPVASFKVGGEEIHNTHLRIGDLTLGDDDMLLRLCENAEAV